MLRRFIGLTLLLAPTAVYAELKPAEIAILAMAQSADSKKVAAHYAKARGVPEHQILLLEGKPARVLSRTDWERGMRPRIRRWLLEQGLEGKIRCLLTTYDVPLAIDRRDPSQPAVAERRQALLIERRRRAEQLLQLIRAAEQIAAKKPAEPPAEKPDAASQVLAQRLEAALKGAQERLMANKDLPERKVQANAFERIFMVAGGIAAMTQLTTNQQKASPDNAELKSRLDQLQGQRVGFFQGFAALESLPDSVERDQQILSLLQQHEGMIGALAWVDRQISLLDGNETYASLDSELSLLYWPNYPLLRSQPNVLHHAHDHNPAQRLRHTLMVARLEAPTVDLTLRLVDTAMAVEKSGLAGKVYLDARGIAAPVGPSKGTNGEYDESLRALARLLKDKTKLDVVLDNEERLFPAGSCPDAALYCGWYSLGKYVDAFRWKPGAVAYHLASIEAQTLREPDSTVWCKSMLERGVCATLGPVYEPYLIAFPLPEEFFACLLTGKRTLVECYYRTSLYNSWVMVLVGDPLYRPFAVNPPLKPEDLPDRLRRVVGNTN